MRVLDDRVVNVTAMSTGAPSYSHPEIGQPDVQVALMKTEKDAILRLVCGFTQPVSHGMGHHWFHISGTGGVLEWKRSGSGKPLLWLADGQMHDPAEMDWGHARTDAPAEARGSGHGDADYYVHVSFRDAVLGKTPLEFDVYRAIETAAPAILAADSIDEGTTLLQVPNFRPSPERKKGDPPQA